MRLIDADKLKEFLSISCKNEILLKQMCDIIDGSPTADVVEVKYGIWKLHNDGSGTCNQCGTTQCSVWDDDNFQHYCGHCGAKMNIGETK